MGINPAGSAQTPGQRCGPFVLGREERLNQRTESGPFLGPTQHDLLGNPSCQLVPGLRALTRGLQQL